MLKYNTMNESDIKIVRNPVSKKIHRRQSFWQIIFPLIFGGILILGLGVWAILITVQGGDVSQSADASLIFLVMPMMVIALIPLLIFAGITYGLVFVRKNLPSVMVRIHQVIEQVHDGIKMGADKAVEPILRINSMVASLQALKRNRE